MREKQSKKRAAPVMPELLAPAGSFEKLVIAVHYGADAVYLGGSRFGLRAKAGVFDEAAIREAVAYAHERRVKVYVTVNIIAHDRDFTGLDDYLEFLASADVDGVIVSDPGIISRMRRVAPNLPIHLSTQANVTNSEAARFWLAQGVTRLNLARELSFSEIEKIGNDVAGEIEVFVHGALCISYSGRCLLSHYMTGRDANQGNCAQPCRYRYALVEEKRPNEFFPVDEDQRGAYIFNSKDLCLLNRVPLLVARGVDSLKIEGRMKSIFYVGGVVRVYRQALEYLKSLEPASWERPEDIVMPAELHEEIVKTGTRALSENFFAGDPGPSGLCYLSSRVDQPYEPVALVRAATGRVLVEVRNVLHIGERITYMHRLPADDIEVVVVTMEDEQGNEIERANPGTLVWLGFDRSDISLEVNGMFRRRRGR